MFKKKKVYFICGARPNFMKIAPLLLEAKKSGNFNYKLIHTGQHYDKEMSDIFFSHLKMPKPDIRLSAGGGSHAQQTAKILLKLEEPLVSQRPDLVLVVGDVNSTLATALLCAKLCLPIAHVEAGLRSFDRTMPEEINRILTDTLSDLLFTSAKEANDNLLKEGISKNKIFFVGNTMIDTLLLLKKEAEKSLILKNLKLTVKGYGLLTLHRPSNVDDKTTLNNIFTALKKVSNLLPIVFPVHPRTKKCIDILGLKLKGSKIIQTPPLGYLDFLNLMIHSKFVLTDSGGIQEETTALNIPCLTLRKNTERPITIKEGTNKLVGSDPKKIIKESIKIINRKIKKCALPQKWDGKTSKRIIEVINKKLS